MFKRAVIALVLAGMVLLGVGQVAAQGYPNRPIKLVVTYPPGASFDIISRILAEKWTQLLGQPVVVENRLGAGGMIAMQSVARAAPDGYTLVTFNTDLAGIVPALYQFKAYDPLKDFAYIGTLMRGTGFIVAVNPKLPVRNIDELGKFAKSAPDGINYGTYGVGSLPHLGFEALNAKLGTKMVHVPYKGGMPSYQAAIVGEVQVVAGTSFIDMLKSGQLRPLAIGGKTRSPQFPELPTLPELGFGEEMFGATYLGVAAPVGTPQAIIDRLSAELLKVSQMPDVIERVGKFAEVSYAPPDELAAMVRRDVNFYAPLVKSLGLSSQ